MSLKTTILALAIALPAMPSTVLAQTAGGSAQTTTPAASTSPERGKVRTACAADIEKFCAGIDRANGGIRACLTANEAQLSEPCKTARAERSASRSK